MTEQIREIIIREGQALFEAHGYDEVSMRQIAAACGISVGNLTYHFPKKEDLLMTIHDRIMEQFLRRIPEEWRTQAGLEGYFAAEYAFHRYIVSTPSIYRMYKQVINSASMRESYFEKHHAMYLAYAEHDDSVQPAGGNAEVPSKAKQTAGIGTGGGKSDFKNGGADAARNSTVAMCALEFHMMETDALLQDFDSTIRKIFMTRIIFLDLDPADFAAQIDCGIAAGRSLAG